MRIQTYLQPFYRALAISCMIYAVTLIANTAAAAQQPCAQAVMHSR